MRLFGYVRVSTSQQSLYIQVKALKDAGIIEKGFSVIHILVSKPLFIFQHLCYFLMNVV